MVKRTEKPKPKTKKTYTLKKLMLLEDAIFNTPERRVQFLQMLEDKIESDDEIDNYFSRKDKVLVRCWVKLGWRPNFNGTKVVINPYA